MKIFLTSIVGLIIIGKAIGMGSISDSHFISNKGSMMSMTEASKIAEKEVNGTVKNIVMDKDNGHLIYHIDVIDNENSSNIDIQVDAKTGSVLKIKEDLSNVAEQYRQEIGQNAKISKMEAIAIARNITPGIATKVDINTKYDYYVVELSNQNENHKIKVDANSGTIIN
ncbi:PepSY domain-containing protein [Lederbergia wuyishanensis]|uniref:Membrane protein YkoI n=1 Tax=Lederbergia wuyishanensis TaxID=1347903 RepID=A0ABU0D4C1_9BACI|nr:PepSY domain-containing protein [Lederbergia wuyishanensis]MCJ8008177.1 PepSY domain-containing protein [Lederbergia wuyishanensis]MDQ0343234.1 putative membrane protein YkoI [Lederbergia wuyishanensis]